MFNFKRYTLKNGLRIILVPRKDSPSVTVSVFVKAGAGFEIKNNNGISHFLEHMCFKGTTKRPTPFAIASELDSLGAFYNAFTSRDITGYYAKSASYNFEKIFDVISDMYLNPVFDEKEINKEKGVIIEEINMYEDDPMSKVGEMLESLMYKDQPAGWSVAGTKENIKKIIKKDFIDYRNAHYISSKTVVVISGNFNEKTALKLTDKYFSNIKKGKFIDGKNIKESQKSPQIAVKFKELDQTHIAIGLRAFSLFDENRYALSLLSDILGGSMSSYLFQKVREEMGAAYYVRSSADLYATHGYLSISAGLNHEKSIPVIKAILGEIERMKMGKISDEDVSKSKEHKIGNFLLSLETPGDLGFFFGDQEVVTGKIEKPEESIKKIKSVTKEQIVSLSNKIFKNNKINLAVVGPYKKEDDFKKVFKI